MTRTNGRHHQAKVTANMNGRHELAKKLGDRAAAFPMAHTMSPQASEMVANAFFLRSQLLNQLIDPRRNIDGECGYPDYISPETYRALYDRHGVGKRVVSIYPEESWAMDPEVYEDEDPTTETEFEEALDNLIRKRNLWSNLHTADEVSGIGCFGIMLLGFDDGQDMAMPVRKGTGDLDEDPPAGKERKLLYVRHFDHSLCRVLKYDLDTSSPRYGQPELYSLSFADYRNGEIQSGSVAETTMRTVHWTRCIHLADNRKTSDSFGQPRMMCVFNNLMDIKKMLGGSAEMFWKGGFPGFAFESTPNLNDLGADVAIDQAAVAAQMDAYQNGLQRWFALLGVQVKSLAPQVSPAGGHLEEQYKAITVAIGTPMRVFMGSEIGQLASGQDALAWSKRLKRRQDKYVGPYIIRPTIERLIWVGVLPAPKDNKFDIVWPDLSSPTDMDKAQTATARTGALATYVSGGIEQIYPPLEYFTKELGFEIDEAQAILEAADQHSQEMDAEQQQQAEQQAKLMKKSGMVPQGGEAGGMTFGQPQPKVVPGKTTAQKPTKPNKLKTNAARRDRLGRLLVNYDPNEPRVGKGSKGGGEWTAGGNKALASAVKRNDALAAAAPKRRVNQAATDAIAAGLLGNPNPQPDDVRRLTARLKALTVWELRALGRKYKIPLGDNKNAGIKKVVRWFAKRAGDIPIATADLHLSATRKRKKKADIVGQVGEVLAGRGLIGADTKARLDEEQFKKDQIKYRRNDKTPGRATVARRKARSEKRRGDVVKAERAHNKRSGGIRNLPDVADWKVGEKGKLATGDIIDTKFLGGGINPTYIVTYQDGLKGVWKPNSIEIARAEAGSSTLADVIGMSDLHPPAIMRYHKYKDKHGDLDEGNGSVQKFEENAIISSKEHEKPFNGREYAKRMAVLDYLIGNSDRHTGNFMVAQPNKDKLIAIDHGYAFPGKAGNSIRSAPFHHVKDDLIPDEFKILDAKVPTVEKALVEIGMTEKQINAVVDNMKTVAKMARESKKFKDIGVHNSWR